MADKELTLRALQHLYLYDPLTHYLVTQLLELPQDMWVKSIPKLRQKLPER